MIDRYLLRYFLAVVRHGTFSLAAQHCRVSQPTLSVGIAKLERLLGQMLFHRSNRRVELTEAGARLLDHANRIETEFAAAEHAVRAEPPTRLIRIGIIPTLPTHWIEQAIAAAENDAANERVEIVEGRMRELLPRLERRRIDVILGILPPGDNHHPIFTERYALALAEHHPFATRDEIEAVELAREPMIARRHCEALPQISQYFTSFGIRPFMPSKTTSDARALAYVRAGLGITVMPESLARSGINMVTLKGLDLFRTIGLVIHEHSRGRVEASPKYRRFADAVHGCAHAAGLSARLPDA